jgi:hypothetical protein
MNAIGSRARLTLVEKLLDVVERIGLHPESLACGYEDVSDRG